MYTAVSTESTRPAYSTVFLCNLHQVRVYNEDNLSQKRFFASKSLAALIGRMRPVQIMHAEKVLPRSAP